MSNLTSNIIKTPPHSTSEPQEQFIQQKGSKIVQEEALISGLERFRIKHQFGISDQVTNLPQLKSQTPGEIQQVDPYINHENDTNNTGTEGIIEISTPSHRDDVCSSPNTTTDTLSYMNPSLSFEGYDHAKWYVSNAKQAASYFVCCLGFEWIAYKGLETGSPYIAAHVVQNGNVTFEFISPLAAPSKEGDENKVLNDIHEFLRKHGDGVKDVAFRVNDVNAVYEYAIKNGGKKVTEPKLISDDLGSIQIATIQVFEDIHHTLIKRIDYRGPFMPGYVAVKGNKNLELTAAVSLRNLPTVKFDKIDHCVQNEDWNQLESACSVYAKIFGFHRFWSVDEKDVSTEYSALRSIVMASANDKVKMPINEPAAGAFKSQIEEFIEFYNGSGIQHIALLTHDIITVVKHMRSRGVQFIEIPSKYYENLGRRLQKYNIKLQEDFNKIREQGILVDFDSNGYLLQLFTKPLSDRPTFFLEFIQRRTHNGFGAGNFKALFESIEGEQRLRGTLTKKDHDKH